MFKSPCKDCEDRAVGCHGSCEKYITVKAAHIEEKSRLRELKEPDRIFYSAKVDAVAKTKKMIGRR